MAPTNRKHILLVQLVMCTSSISLNAFALRHRSIVHQTGKSYYAHAEKLFFYATAMPIVHLFVCLSVCLSPCLSPETCSSVCGADAAAAELPARVPDVFPV